MTVVPDAKRQRRGSSRSVKLEQPRAEPEAQEASSSVVEEAVRAVRVTVRGHRECLCARGWLAENRVAAISLHRFELAPRLRLSHAALNLALASPSPSPSHVKPSAQQATPPSSPDQRPRAVVNTSMFKLHDTLMNSPLSPIKTKLRSSSCVTVTDLLAARLLKVGDELSYKHYMDYTATLRLDGLLQSGATVYNSLSQFAKAVAVRVEAGRRSEFYNGWATVYCRGKSLDELRADYLAHRYHAHAPDEAHEDAEGDAAEGDADVDLNPFFGGADTSEAHLSATMNSHEHEHDAVDGANASHGDLLPDSWSSHGTTGSSRITAAPTTPRSLPTTPRFDAASAMTTSTDGFVPWSYDPTGSM